MSALLLGVGASAVAQPLRAVGLDISYWNCGTSSGGIGQANFNTGYSSDNRQFVFIRATRGGTTGVDQHQGTPGGGTTATHSHRYDDSRFVQKSGYATTAGMDAGPYHFAPTDDLGNTGSDEADHFIQMAGAWMRPGYLMPMFDQEAGSGSDTLVQFAMDFSDRIYAMMQIRPCIYINGNYSSIFQGATQARRDAIAKPWAYTPSVISPDFPMLWDARYYPTGTDPNTIPIQTGNPKDNPTTLSTMYGPWDDYGNLEPWSFWQYSSIVSIPGFNNVDSTDDGDVSHGDIEYVRNYLVPAVWWTDLSGDWSTLANWNSGQAVVAPVTPPDQAPPYATGPVPTPRLPGASGSGPDSGQYDTVILERTNANITVTLSSGAYNIRKLYMREALNITGGSLTINYNPNYRANDSTLVFHGGTNSAQFSGPVALSGGASLSVHTLQVDATQTFTLGPGTLAFNTIKLMPHSTTPAKILMNGDVTLNSVATNGPVIANGAGSGSSGKLDLGAATRAFNVPSAVTIFVKVPVSNGGLAKTGTGTMRLDIANTYAAGTTISAGALEGSVAGSVPGNVTNTAGTLKLDTTTTMASGATLALANSPAASAVNLNFSGTQTISALYFGTTRKAAGTWAASAASHNNAAFSSSGILNVTTGPASITTLSRTSGSSPSTYGDSLTFTATVTGNAPGGTVQLKVDGVAVGSPVTLISGSASLVISTLSVSGSPHLVAAYYNGDDNNGLSDSSASPVSQVITAKPLTANLTGTVSKTYNGTTAAALAAGNYSLPGVVGGDTVNLNNPSSGTYDTRNIGTGKTVNVSGLAISGPASTNYTLSSTSASAAIGTISKTNLTLMAVANTKSYDGAINAAATPIVTVGSIQTGDSTSGWTETYDTKDVGTNKTLTASGTVIDGNGGANYNVTFANNNSGVITALATSCSLASSENPSASGSNVTFIASVNGAPPAADLPTGNVIFSANGAPFATNALVSGSIGASTASLPSGTNAMTAEYLGDGNFLGSTGALNQVVTSSVTCSQTNAVLSMADNHDGTFTLTFVGTPQAQYYVLASSDLAAPMTSWTPLADSTNTVTNVNGLWQFTVTNTAPQQFYRGTAIVPCP
ncbi:MAG: hypothetical protein QOJ40_1279 [Verrucomicrobiota bacterium]